MNQFNEDATRLAERVRTVEREQLDRHLPAILGSLARAVSTLDGRPIVSHWPSSSEVDATRRPGAAAPASGPSIDTLPELVRRLGSSPPPAGTAEDLEQILDYLRRAEPFPELGSRSATYRRVVARALDFADALAAASWMDEAAQERYRQRLAAAVALFRDANSRERGQRQLDRLEASRAVIERITVLGEHRDVDLRSIRLACFAADEMFENPAEAAQGRAARSTTGGDDADDRVPATRAAPPVPRDLRTIERTLDRSYRQAEATVIEALGRIAEDPSTAADPAWSSVVADHAQYLEDLERLRLVPRWIDAVTLMSPEATGPFRAQARTMCTWLLEPTRRPDAILAMDQFQQQLQLFYPLPFESELRGGDPLAEQATGGLQERVRQGARRAARPLGQGVGARQRGGACSAASAAALPPQPDHARRGERLSPRRRRRRRSTVGRRGSWGGAPSPGPPPSCPVA